ncbi:MAG: sigma-54 dependent transcriptional regulator [Candidatus Thiodiazotropha sp. (ex Monitilora ramsayi)]|nr:sigma-54 dependent transcriptional regulator [Candidatus Thiodiazotropha sp. (ex Monitilora ramsayi)]
MDMRILIVDDEETLLKNLQRFLENQGYQTETANCLVQARQWLKSDSFDIVLTDRCLPDGDGSQLLTEGNQLSPDSVFIMMTGNESIDSALDAFHSGACDYLIKPFSFQSLSLKLKNISQYRNLERQNRILRESVQRCLDTENLLVGNSQALQKVMSMVYKLGPASSTVLITGESGTGKDLVARSLHSHSNRKDQAFIALNMAALPEELVESQLFGHVRGAFTGAEQAREGAFRTASGGTLFLDEIGELSLKTQAKLLRVLEEQMVQPVGSDKSIKTDVRVLAATNRDLSKMVEEGKFRQDLLYRLNVLEIHIPPLRERFEDIPALVEHLVLRFSSKHGKVVECVDQTVIQAFMGYPWKGNVRELANVLERAILLCDGDSLDISDLSEEFAAAPESDAQILSTAVERFKYQHIISVLETVDYKRDKAAKLLGMSPATLYRQMDKLGLKGFDGRH